MSREDALGSRIWSWLDAFELYGYEVPQVIAFAEPSLALKAFARTWAGEFSIRAIRPSSYPGPATTVDICETLFRGVDPLRLSQPFGSYYLGRASWHAQYGPGSEFGERVDIDPRKPRDLQHHIHPFGKPNETRETTSISTPRAWLARIEFTIERLNDEPS